MVNNERASIPLEADPALLVQRKAWRARCVIADDHDLILDQVERLLGEKGYEVAARASDGRALLETVEVLRPDIAIVDISMPELDGIETARVISNSSLDTKVVILSIHDEPAYVEAAFQAGALGYVVKLDFVRELTTAVKTVLGGSSYLSHALRESFRIQKSAFLEDSRRFGHRKT